ncbi:disease resistance protein RGA2-like isoform X1 [Chenopodium quinoa]|uniref:disease resistance protein RGA2-like isoform X1 n=1 Tax=Chenopodium quinoa TaxID=63459 RepID=UPI000B785E3D|nr:disease resistance protein RGA2-like isoform X1 [Chenopodium quinoa]XP_021753181.1 disease resistance protein RGA2-like isoform X1 [Chenopodium quinoa]XP_021753182.1 disease resistance protein RGA2-like isoform X1 [Chenopodium quinoa]XP_021753183.1 disease resistance protein RGA2-like isoform X1 [Chenopodium quinoa]XP_021753184.1 disease resistance protein RGA2-like isoform X1 [Chenopodium quinoa]XP_021753185.1 disease resistance protein RGA2-like isoform X1 [Chenopodium quinoa]
MDVSGGLTLVQFVVEKLGSPIWTQIEAVLGLESELDKLRETMSTIEAVLLDAEVVERLHQACRTNVERNKLKRLKEALYRADDLLDEITTLAHLKKLMPCNNNKVCNEVCLFFSRSNQFRFASNWSREMKKISEMLDRIVNDHRYDIGSAGFDAANQMRINARETHSYVCEDDVFVGREEDKRKVIDMLLNNTVEQQDGLVVSIVGIGGLGKTTLAQQLYNDQMIVKKFPQRKWVCVSDAFDVKVIVGQILAAVNSGIDQDRLNLDQLQTKLRKEMDGKKYFLVLDDVWNEESSKWLQLRNVLIGGERVSRILVTTRSRMVADVVGSHWTHELEGLSDDESLDLFKKIALKPEENPVKQQLVDIGKEIVRKCANVPLAIRVVGSLLRGQEESKWENLKNTDLANIVQDESNGIIPVLKISYNYLPFHLKSCFSYCAVFPKDYKIIKEDLICLWMAQGFIMPSDAESFEDVGEEYFKQLLQRCFFQDVERAEGTKEIISCKMHDLIHDLAKEVAGTDILSCTYSTRCFNEKTRHVYMDESTPKDVVGKLRNMQRMRTFLCTGDRVFSLIPILGDVSKVKYLRVLCLNYCYGLQKLPSGIGEWVHLRYLDLSGNVHLCVLPSSITKLYNLQTLKLRGCRHLKRLPRELRKLVNLRHLDICGCWSLTCMPPGMNSMASLRNLTGFVVSGSATSNAAWSWRSTDVGQLEDLNDFTNYTHTMEIVVKKDVRCDAVGGGMLFKSPKLWKVEYNWDTKENTNAEVLLKGLQPHSNLRELKLLHYPGVRLPTWMMTLSCCLPNLAEIEIRDCEVEYMESSSINSGDDDESVFFPSLEKLKLENMPKLKGWWKPSSSESGESDRIPQAPVLSHLNVSGCPNLTTLFLGASMNLKSCLPNIAKIEICDCKRLEHLPLMSQLRHLKDLALKGLSEVEYMESSSINSGDDDELVFFPSLENLKLKNMPKLKGWWKSSSESEESETPHAPKLSRLDIYGCPELTTVPLFPGLQELYLEDFNEALGPIMRETTHGLSSSSVSNNNHKEDQGRQGKLREVKTDNVGYLTSLPIHSFHYLSYLWIGNDHQMEELKTGEVGEVFRSGRLSSLRSLAILDCKNLKSISGRGVWDQFTGLESLSLDLLPQLELEDEDDVINNKSTEAEMPWRYLAPTLRSLFLYCLPKVVKLPGGIGCLSSLHSLEIEECDNLESLTPSIGGLSSLHSLRIIDCNNLESLTPSIGGLSSLQSLTIDRCSKLKRMPEEMRHLTSLTELRIRRCSPVLMKECKNKNGANWSNIQHIPNIKLDLL